MQAYPRIKRLAVLAARDAGKSTPEVAKKYGVSPSWVRRVVQERRELGKLGPYKFCRRDRHDGSAYRRARYAIMEDPRITVKELERVIGMNLSIDDLGMLKAELDSQCNIRWYGGLNTEFVLSPSGNYLTQPRGPVFSWELEQELESLKAGESIAKRPAFHQYQRGFRIDTSEYPML